MPARNEPRPSLLAKAGRSRLRRLANELEERHGPGRAAPGAPDSLIARAARKLAANGSDLAALDFAEKKAVLELLWRRRNPWIPLASDIADWLRWAETGWKPRIAETRACIALLRHFDPDNPAAAMTRDWLENRQDALWGRFGDFARAWRLWEGAPAVARAAESLARGDLAFLREAERNAQTRTVLQGSGFMVAVTEAYARRLSQDAAPDQWTAIGPLLDFFEPGGLLGAGGPASARARAKIAIIEGLVSWAAARAAPEAIAHALKMAFRIAGDPRAGLDDWLDLPEGVLAQVELWLVEDTLESSFRIVEELRTDEREALAARRDFWRSYLPFVTRARLIGARKAQSAAATLGAPCCGLKTYLSDHCGFVLELRGPEGRRLMALELNNLAQTLFWAGDNARAPRFDQRLYDVSALRGTSDAALSHLPPIGWTEKFAAVIENHAGLAASNRINLLNSDSETVSSSAV
ncbi:EH signature domain-containing protein [Rhodoblastus sp.]|uniref:EH signature domain-containing protein n=1 Tax=Rhodoblastus sp. TaxID=1962975 RepID=UPI0035AF4BC5